MRTMYSYRHAFHAGNHADVLKHVVLVAVLRHLMRKSTPLTLVDTHAGAGLYRLDGAAAQTSGEAQAGIQRLLQQAATPANPELEPGHDALADYLALLARFNKGDGPWRSYPGSPLLVHALMDEPERAAVHDRLRLFELHPTDYKALKARVEQLRAGRRVSVERRDGFEALKALLPPPATAGGSRRAAVLIDPSYEIKSDYAKVATAIQDALQRFATGVYLVWHPIIPRAEAHALPRRLQALAGQAGRSWLHATLSVGNAPGNTGLAASGMFVINPPHTTAALLRTALPVLQGALARGAHAGWNVTTTP